MTQQAMIKQVTRDWREGPAFWDVSGHTYYRAINTGTRVAAIAHVIINDFPDGYNQEQNEANFKLLLAAPRLGEALHELYTMLENQRPDWYEPEKFRDIVEALRQAGYPV